MANPAPCAAAVRRTARRPASRHATGARPGEVETAAKKGTPRPHRCGSAMVTVHDQAVRLSQQAEMPNTEFAPCHHANTGRSGTSRYATALGSATRVPSIVTCSLQISRLRRRATTLLATCAVPAALAGDQPNRVEPAGRNRCPRARSAGATAPAIAVLTRSWTRFGVVARTVAYSGIAQPARARVQHPPARRGPRRSLSPPAPGVGASSSSRAAPGPTSLMGRLCGWPTAPLLEQRIADLPAAPSLHPVLAREQGAVAADRRRGSALVRLGPLGQERRAVPEVELTLRIERTTPGTLAAELERDALVGLDPHDQRVRLDGSPRVAGTAGAAAPLELQRDLGDPLGRRLPVRR